MPSTYYWSQPISFFTFFNIDLLESSIISSLTQSVPKTSAQFHFLKWNTRLYSRYCEGLGLLDSIYRSTLENPLPFVKRNKGRRVVVHWTLCTLLCTWKNTWCPTPKPHLRKWLGSVFFLDFTKNLIQIHKLKETYTKCI